MTVSLTATHSPTSNPPSPNDMTSTTASPSPPVPPQSSSVAGIEASSPNSAIVKEDEEEAAAERSESPVVEAGAKPMALDSNHGDEETEEETATEYAGDDETSHVGTKSDSDCKVSVSKGTSKQRKHTSDNNNTSDRCDDGDQHEEDADDDREPVNEMPSESGKKDKMTCESGSKKAVNADSKGSHSNSEPVAGETKSLEATAKSQCESEPMSSENIGEMARLRAAKFIQERTKMACILNSSAESESTKQTPNPTTATNNQQGSSRKRKLTVKDILVSQRNRDSGNKQQRIHESQPANTNNTSALSQMFSGLGPMLDPSLHMNDANPFAAISAALAAAASANGSASNGTNLPSGLMSDSQSAYISTLASTLSSNANPTATLALMASLSAMMQNSSNSKESNEGASAGPTANPLVSLESTLANVMASNFGQSSGANQNNNSTHDELDDDDGDDRMDGGPVPLDFSLKHFVQQKDEKTSSSRRKSRKKVNGEGATEDETPLDLSCTTKRPDESSPNKHDNPLAAMFPHANNNSMDGANGSNFAAMAAAAAAAAAAASFSPNLLSKMAASMAPWSGYGGGSMQGLGKLGNDPSAAAVAFNVLFQQMNNSNNNNGGNGNNGNNGNSSNKSGSAVAGANSPANLFQAQFPDLYTWNGKLKSSTPSPSFGGLSNSSLSARHHHHQPPPAASQPMRTKSSSGRQNPWQAQWINRSSEQTRDVFTCVWCKESFKSLAEMTDHMKRSPRCGMAGMQQHHSHHNSHPQASSGHHAAPPTGGALGPSPQSQSGKLSALSSPSNSALSAAMKEASSASLMGNSNSSVSSVAGSNSKPSGGVNMPRKLVRGQDVWLGRGAEQTRQILKCMWCGQSFKSLADMTQHMKITQHYTNIISQEQITSWRTPEEKMAQSQVNAVLTCKVCDEAFGSLKELSNHMIKNSHFKENSSTRDSSGRSTPTSLPVPVPASSSSRGGRSATSSGAPSSDRRKKSLPVRKLLELERGGEFKRGVDDDEADESQKSPKSTVSQLIECDDCHEKIEPRCFLQHIKQCRTRNASKSDAESEKSKAESEKGNDDDKSSCYEGEQNHNNSKRDPKNEEGKESESEKKVDDAKNGGSKNDSEETGSGSSGSVLSALEKLIEKNFDSKSRRSQQTGILQRLGIDEEVFPPWQNMAPSPLSAMSPTMATWNSMNGMEFSRSNSSSSSNSRVNSAAPAIPQLRYRRNSSSASLKDKFLSGLSASIKATESNGSFSSQETEEEESCDESNSDCGNGVPHHRSQKRPLYSSRSPDKSGRLNFPISSMLSSPVPARPTSALSASSTASSISPSEPITPSQSAAEQLHRMTPSSHRSAQDEEDDDEMGSPLALCSKRSAGEGESAGKRSKLNGASDDGDDNEAASGGGERSSHNPLLQLQKLLDKTDTSARHGSKNGPNAANQRMSPFAGWHDSASLKASSPASSPRTPPIHSPSSTSAKSDEASYLTPKCAFCDTQIASRSAYRSHIAKIHLAMRDSVDLSAVSDEELLLLVLAKNSNLPLVPGGNSGLLAAASAKVSPRVKESSSKRKSKADLASWDKSPNHPTNSPAASPQLETSQSKFLKYAELGKQLSSKYV